MKGEKRILVTDDDDAIRALLATILRRRGFKVDTARNGVEALERCAQCRYSLVILDLMMPRMSGYEVLNAVEAMPAADRPLVLVLTAGAPPQALDPNIVAGALRKPFDIEMLIDTVVACVTSSSERVQISGCPAEEGEGVASPSQSGSKPN